MRFQLSEDQTEREGFLRESRELSELIERTKPHLVTPQETEQLASVESAYKTYLAETTPLLERGIRGIRKNTTEQLARTIAEKSATMLERCETLIEANQAAWESVLVRSDHSVNGVIRLMQLSAGLVLVLFAVLLILAYRAFVTPLQNRLDAHAALLQRQDTEDLQIIGSEINRLERIVQDFLRFARPSEPEFKRVSANQLLQEVQTLLLGQFEKQSVQLVVEPLEDVWLRADKEQLKQVLINLAQNAAESMQANGTVTLRARNGVAKLRDETQPAAMLEVVDTGPGIPPEVESRLFDPFFSTKQGGTGLGLPIAARIIEKHGGYIQYQSQRNRGTTFSVTLPRWSGDARKDSTH